MHFHEQRRQQFLDESAYRTSREFFENSSRPTLAKTLLSNESNEEDRERVSAGLADYTFANFMLRYTAGEPLSELGNDLTEVIEAFEQATAHARAYAKRADYPPLRFVEIDDYERTMQLIGLCYLLHRRDLLSRIAAMLDPSSACEDTLYEDLLSFELSDRYEIEEFFHEKPYGYLIDSFYRETAAERIGDVTKYLKGWYKGMAKTPWFDSHMGIGAAGCGGYFGYWAVEAAAAVYLLDIDDRTFREHLVYPKDLVDFARKMDVEAESLLTVEQDLSRLRVEGGQPCLRAGYWATPAHQDSRRLFKAGEIMPTFEHSPYGATIWQWSEEQ